MMKKFLILAAFIPSVAIAQQQDKELTLKLHASQIPLLGEALAAMPYGKVAPLMNELQIQVQSQMRPEPPPTPAKVEPKPEEPKK